jgi:predicted N-acetyltransferase YhbS
MTIPLRIQVPRPATPRIASERAADRAAVDRLVADAFGPGHFAKAAERLREGRSPCPDLSFVAWHDEAIVGCVRQWSIMVGDRPAIFLGPIAVDPDWRRHGLGAALIERASAAVWAAGHDLILLVGDPPFFEPLGFEPVPKGQIVMPGPVDPRRLMARGPAPGAAATLSGVVRAR